MGKIRGINTVLVYRWNSLSEPMAIEAFQKNGYKVVQLQHEITDYHADAVFAQKLIQLIHSMTIDLVFSYDYFPIISMICEINQLPYVSWIYDCPVYTLYSKTVENPCNHIFCFDENYTKKLKTMGAKNPVHFPLACDTELYDAAVRKAKEDSSVEYKYANEVSFVGDLYNGEKNRLRYADLSSDVKMQVEELLEQQKNIYSRNIVAEQLSQEAAQEIVERCHLSMSGFYEYNPADLAVDAVLMERTARDREEILTALGADFNIGLYTTSDIPENIKTSSRILVKGKVDYWREMPLVFHNSKINLNITSRTIETGIPQRILDILSCGGFCMTNEQTEIEDYFTDGKELVIYRSPEDLKEKTAYYLTHEEQREKIARAGLDRIKKEFSCEMRIKRMIDSYSQNNGNE